MLYHLNDYISDCINKASYCSTSPGLRPGGPSQASAVTFLHQSNEPESSSTDVPGTVACGSGGTLGGQGTLSQVLKAGAHAQIWGSNTMWHVLSQAVIS